ncbi:MAG: AAA family ATPase [Chrysiogenia bacterium]
MNEKKQVPIGEKNPHVILLYGQSKIGLSTIAAQFPAPLFLNINDDLEQIKTRSLKIGSWEEFLEHALEISKGKYAPQTIIVSHTDGLWDLAQDFVVESFNKLNGANVKALADASYSLWKEALKLFEAKLVKLSGLGNLVLLAHEIVENRNFNGIERSIVQANLERQIGARVTNLADAVGRVLLVESGARLVTFQPAPHQITGSRLPELLKKQYVIETGKRPEFIDELENIQQQAKKIA